MRRIPPSRILAREMPARDISVIELATLSGLSWHVIAGVLLGDLVVDAAIAQGLSQALGSSVEFWLRLQSTYQGRAGKEPRRRKKSLRY
jgi:plasmid maintenance system antidote protein VapI